MGRLLLSMAGGVSGCIIVLGGMFLGCGDAADPAPSNPPTASPEDERERGAAGQNSELDERFARAGSTPACDQSFSACGGLLASEWVVEDTCGAQLDDHEDAEAWSREHLGLDAAACPSTVTTLDSTWSGTLSFRDGDAVDGRLRTDALELELTRECLSASYGEAALESTCAALSDGSLECVAQGDACHCSGHREVRSAATGVYGVLGTSVAVAQSPVTRYEYCVAADDVLHWMESNQRIVLRRVPGTAAPSGVDPVPDPR
jgi:hypothetical protein